MAAPGLPSQLEAALHQLTGSGDTVEAAVVALQSAGVVVRQALAWHATNDNVHEAGALCRWAAMGTRRRVGASMCGSAAP